MVGDVKIPAASFASYEAFMSLHNYHIASAVYLREVAIYMEHLMSVESDAARVEWNNVKADIAAFIANHVSNLQLANADAEADKQALLDLTDEFTALRAQIASTPAVG
jgi:fibrillarin-like rRNA methylase